MKKLKLSLIACTAVSLFGTLNAATLSDALKNGKVSGDVSIQYESRNQDKEASTYYSNTAYAMGSIGLNYDTASYNNLSAHVGFRAYSVLFEDDKNFKTAHGTGDATERYYDEKGLSALSKAYIQYNINSLNAKVGRQVLSTDWLTMLHDAVNITVKPNDNLSLNAIYTKKRGRTRAKDLRPMKSLNNGDGIYKLTVDYKPTNQIKLTPYFLSAPDAYDVYGAKIAYDSKSFGALAHTMKTNEENAKDGEMLELKAYAKFSGYKATLGFVKTGDDNGWGSAANAGDKVVPFEEGDQMYVKDSQTTYFQLSKTISDISLTALYGITKYQQYENNELNIWAGYKINKDLKLSLGYALVNEDSKDTSRTDLEQLNANLTYKF